MVHQQRDRHSDYWATIDWCTISLLVYRSPSSHCVDPSAGVPLVSESIVRPVVTVSIPLLVYH
jgi:hypothetical protein